MRLYIHMMLGGSICTLLYILFNHALSCELPLKWRKAFLRINMEVYLLPLPWIAAKGKEGFRFLLEKAGMVFQERGRSKVINTASMWQSIFIMDEKGKLLYITGYQDRLFVVGLFALIFLALTAGWLYLYLRTCRRYRRTAVFPARFPGKTENGINNGVLPEKLRVGLSSCITTPLTIGIIRPIILFPEVSSSDISASDIDISVGSRQYGASTESIIRHELNHISGKDMLGRFFAFVIVAMGWYNPLSYYLLKEEVAVSELLCDEAAVKGRSKREKADYIRCIIETVPDSGDTRIVAAFLVSSKSLMEERVKRLMGKYEKRQWKRKTAVVIMAVCFAIGSIPALAYELPGKYTVTTEDSFGLDEGWKDVDMMVFISDEDIEKAYQEFRSRDLLFMGENGKLCCMDSFGMEIENREKEQCRHNYVSGILAQHVKRPGGSCTVATWEAVGCAGCGKVTATGRRLATAGGCRCIHFP